MAFIQKIWQGEASLWFTFWVLGVFILFVLRLFEIATDNISPTAGQAGYLFSLCYYTLYSVVLWRTAGNKETDVFYANLVRAFLLLGWGRYLLTANFLGGVA